MKYVLFIEPNVLLADTYIRALQGEGWQVEAVDNAQAAIDIADQRLPDVIVLELQLSAYNGIDFLQEFRSYQEWQDVPVVVLTNVPVVRLEAVESGLHELGVHTILHKPRTSLAMLRRVLKEQARSRAAPTGRDAFDTAENQMQQTGIDLYASTKRREASE